MSADGLDTMDNKAISRISIHHTLGHDDVIKWKHFLRYWPFVRGIHRSPVNSTHKGQWRGALMFSLICAWINGWVNNCKAGDLRRHRAHYDVTVMVGLHLCSPLGYFPRFPGLEKDLWIIIFIFDRCRRCLAVETPDKHEQALTYIILQYQIFERTFSEPHTRFIKLRIYSTCMSTQLFSCMICFDIKTLSCTYGNSQCQDNTTVRLFSKVILTLCMQYVRCGTDWCKPDC